MSDFMEIPEQSLQPSPLDSNRFGLRIFRGNVEQINEQHLLSTILKENIDIAIIRLPSEKQFQISRLDKTGLPYIVADTLVYYYVDLSKYSPKELKNQSLMFVECYPEHAGIISGLVERIFPDYTNHYYSNPFLKKADILEGYKEWAQNYAVGTPGRISWYVKRDEHTIGFVSCAYDQNECEIVLNGVVPEASGKGVYGDIIRFTQQYFKNMGCQVMKISTQIQNYAVQKVWSREGFVIRKAYSTIHINAFMNHISD